MPESIEEQISDESTVQVAGQEISKISFRMGIVNRLNGLRNELARYEGLLLQFDEFEAMSLIMRCYETEEGELTLDVKEKKPAGFPMPNSSDSQ